MHNDRLVCVEQTANDLKNKIFPFMIVLYTHTPETVNEKNYELSSTILELIEEILDLQLTKAAM